MPSNRAHIPTPETAKKWPHLEKIADKLMPLSDVPVGLLIGYNCSRALAPRDVIAPVGDEPYTQRTDLGWGIVGVVHLHHETTDPIGISHHILTRDVSTKDVLPSAHSQISLQTRIKEVITPLEVARMLEIDFSERHSDEQGPSFEDLRFLKIMKEGIHRTYDQHYEIPLPLRDTNHKLPNNRHLALRRLRQLELKFQKNPTYQQDYTTFMQKMINDGFAELIPKNELEGENGQVWYIPHHGVYHPKKPTKIRVVFDCSAKCKGESLNDNLLQGPDLMNKLVGVLCRFRQEQVALTCDIEQMFFQFRVDESHRNLLRFLWFSRDDPKGEPKDYRMNVHLFGAASSPACANFGLKQTAADFEEEFGSEAANFVRNDFYVDDGLKAVPTVKEAIDLITNSKQMCQKGGLRLHKFLSNCREVIYSIPPDDRAQGIQDIDLVHENLPIERTLGIFWCIESDLFKFRITLQGKPMTRRGILSTISSIYDPLGFLAPVMLKGKQILQELCKGKAEWDSDLPADLLLQWEQWRTNLNLLETAEIPRCFKPAEFGAVKTAELHHLSDASSTGYGQCTYLRLIDNEGRVHISFVMGKSRVAPLKTVTIPRLELTAALVSIRVSNFLSHELELKNISNIFWTDSRIVLGYLSNDSRRFHVFVSNRVQQIRNYSDPSQWRYVPTKENPADEGSRGISAKEFMTKSTWLTGPEFLWQSELPPTDDKYEVIRLQPDDPEVKQVKSFVTHTEPSEPSHFLKRLEHFSKWTSVRRAVAVCLRLATNTTKPKYPCSNQKYLPCDVDELSKAESVVICLLQDSAFSEDIKQLRLHANHSAPATLSTPLKKSSPLYRLDPYIDNKGILRVGGRLKNATCTDGLKNPIILPKRHQITQLIIRHIHEKIQHQGRGITLNAIRESGYWIQSGSSEVYRYISQCVKCRKYRASVQEQKMADLPEDRVNPAPPFTYCAVDCFGPWYIRDGRKE